MRSTYIPRANQSRPVDTSSTRVNTVNAAANALDKANKFKSQLNATQEAAKKVLEHAQVQREKELIKQCDKDGYIQKIQYGNNGPIFFKNRDICMQLKNGSISSGPPKKEIGNHGVPKKEFTTKEMPKKEFVTKVFSKKEFTSSGPGSSGSLPSKSP